MFNLEGGKLLLLCAAAAPPSRGIRKEAKKRPNGIDISKTFIDIPGRAWQLGSHEGEFPSKKLPRELSSAFGTNF